MGQETGGRELRFDEVLNELKSNPEKGFRRAEWETNRYITLHDEGQAKPFFVTVYPIGEEEYGYSRYYPCFEEAVAEDWVEVTEIPYTAEEWIRINLIYDIIDHIEDAQDSMNQASHIARDMCDMSDLYERLSDVEIYLNCALKKAEHYRDIAEKKE